MDRNIVYPGSIPLDTDLLAVNRNTMVAIGALAQAIFGTGTVVDGLGCLPTIPSSMSVNIGPGSIGQLSTVDANSYGSLAPDTADPLVKMGINLGATSFNLVAPTTSGQSANFLIQASLLESDTTPVVLPYYNSANPSQPFSGANNNGVAQSTQRIQRVQLQLKAGAPAVTGGQTTPPVDAGWVGLYAITVSYGQTAISVSNITTLPSAPFLTWKLSMLRPGFGSGVQAFTASSNFVVPAGITVVDVEVWGAGAGSYASVSGTPSGGGSGGGYARRRIAGVVPGQVVPITVGTSGVAGTTGGLTPGGGGTSSFGVFASATGGSLNSLATLAYPLNGATPGGIGIGGDINIAGSAGQAGVQTAGGLGGGAPMSGMQNSGSFGVQGLFPGGGASGAGTGAAGTTPYNGASGAGGLVVVRW